MLSWLNTLSVTVANLKAQIRHGLGTAALACVGFLFCLMAAVYLVAAFHSWLTLHWPPHLAFLVTAGGLFGFAAVILIAVKMRTRSSHQDSRETPVVSDLTREAEQAAQRASLAARLNVRGAPVGALLTAVAIGLAVGFLRPPDR